MSYKILFPEHLLTGHEQTGRIQHTHVADDRVRQVSLAVTGNVPQCFHPALQNWLVMDDPSIKGALLQKAFNRVRLAYSGPILVPDILTYGTEVHKDVHFPYWEMSTLPGSNLHTMNTGVVPWYEIAQQLIQLLDALHTYEPETHTSLRAYYKERFESFLEALTHIAPIYVRHRDTITMLRDTISRALNMVCDDQVVSPGEQTTWIHGDTHWNNVMYEPTARIIGLFDFEQGMFPGDPISDLYKLGLIIEKKHNLYNFTPNEREILLEMYSRSLPKNIDGRIVLMRINIFIPMLLLRHAMGWNFYRKQTRNGSFVGVDFIFKLIQKAFTNS